jgi:hypothetical protein
MSTSSQNFALVVHWFFHGNICLSCSWVENKRYHLHNLYFVLACHYHLNWHHISHEFYAKFWNSSIHCIYLSNYICCWSICGMHVNLQLNPKKVSCKGRAKVNLTYQDQYGKPYAINGKPFYYNWMASARFRWKVNLWIILEIVGVNARGI